MIETSLQLENFENAIGQLEEALTYDPEKLGIVLDAVIQRFEFSFELAWKSIKVVAKASGRDCRSPKRCLKLAYEMGWIKDEDKWLQLLEARNLTSHTYDRETAREVYGTVKENFEEFNGLLGELKREVLYEG